VFPEKLVNGLSTVQKMRVVEEGLSCVQAIMKLNDDLKAAADWRKGGHAATF
jgi:gamma-glutamyltranspeptidase